MTTYRSGTEQTIFDVALDRYGNLSGLATLLTDNPQVVLSDGSLQQFRQTYIVGPATPALTELELAPAPAKPSERGPNQQPAYLSNGQQTVFDVALMQYGSLGGLALILADNPALVKDTGLVEQFRVSHAIQPAAFTNARMKRRMLALVPCTGDLGENNFWVDDDNTWIDDNSQPWTEEG